MRNCVLFAEAPEEVSGIARDAEVLGLSVESRSFDSQELDYKPELALVWASDDVSSTLSFCAILGKQDEMSGVPLVVVVRRENLREVFLREGVFDDFVVFPYELAELDARLRLLLWRNRQAQDSDEVSIGGLHINHATYQVHLHGQSLDLTYMEYELLKFLASTPGRVFTREILLSRVWGYDNYGGTRTVDVHVRRLRAKLGEHASLVQTVRHVGYRFANPGKPR